LGLTGLRGLPFATRIEASVLAASCSRSAMGKELEAFFLDFFDVGPVDAEGPLRVLE
jgi:hypothetical protein